MDWIRHFDFHTASRTKGKYRLLILNGHNSHHSEEFETYYQEHNIITLYIPPHSSHLLQPLDISYFTPLKKAYSRQIEQLMRMNITHISKLEFLCAFREAFFTSITENNIQGGFSGARLVPYDPEKVISKLDIRIRTPTPPASSPGTALPWLSQTPHNPREATSQSEFIKTRISNHQGSSPTPMLATVDRLAKGTMAIMHKVTLLRTKVSALRKANKGLSKRRRAKKTCIRLGGSLTVQEAQDLLDQKAVSEQLVQERRQNGSGAGGSRTKIRCCGVYGKPGHNVRTCKEAAESSDSSVSDSVIIIS